MCVADPIRVDDTDAAPPPDDLNVLPDHPFR
jgi:hypothetical protein